MFRTNFTFTSNDNFSIKVTGYSYLIIISYPFTTPKNEEVKITNDNFPLNMNLS